ncbi:TolC family protein [Candidatus Nitronereus thalassa]|uniref:TolC family protein n=1 Tax=Candidatus Nitronereus thalassa TaxID=3020898 RepID=A0ABU3K9W1_9BACT|nr:TolC family protein [Candidatus Nitronereus thalassa]MDT7043119.1 TolC family protein [Candidatus Nitronereus thalassa]
MADGPYQDYGWGKVVNSKLFLKEILELTRGEYKVIFPQHAFVHGNWSVKKIKKAVDFLLADPKVDLVLALGVLASHDIARRPFLPKPAVAPFVIDIELQELPFHRGTSGVRNLSYLSLPHSFERAVKAYREILPFTKMTLFVDQAVIEALPQLEVKIQRAAKASNLQITPVPVGTYIQPALAAIPDDAEAVLVTPLLRLPLSEFQALTQGLVERKLPSFSLFGREEVEYGLLASIAPETNTLRLARRVALNVHRILLGEDAGSFLVSLPEAERLTINMATARAVEAWPTFRVLTEADLINEDVESVTRRLSLYSVVREAVSVNLDLAAADRRVSGGQADVRNARSALLPQIGMGSRATIIDQDRARSAFGANPERSMRATGSLSQLLYSDKAWSDFTVQEKAQLSRVAERNELRLDILQEAAVAYLNVLRAKTSLRVQKDNLKLTRSNLELARVRESVGSAARDEVFRWESEIANGRIAVLEAQAQLKQVNVSLNRTLHRPLEEPFITEEASLHDPLLFGDLNRLFTFIDNPKHFGLFRNFQVQEGLNVSPEIQRLNAVIAGQERTVLNAQRAYWAPDLALQADVDQRFASDGAGQAGPPAGLLPGQDNTQWSVGLGLTFPLFSGGSKEATESKALEELRRLRLEREATIGRVEERIRSAMFRASASFPGIRLSREAAEASKKNLELVVDQYSRGAVDIIKLLNSQNAALTANEAAANAVYDFLIDLMSIERAVGRFDYFLYEEDRAAWFERLTEFFEQAGVTPSKLMTSSPF